MLLMEENGAAMRFLGRFIKSGLLLAGIHLFIGAAYAVPFTTDLSASGSINIDAGFLSATNGATLTGSIAATEGGSDTASSYTGAGVAGSNPINAAFTDFGDGFHFSGDAEASSGNGIDQEFSAGIDFVLNLANTSATDNISVTVQLRFDHFVDADGTDAFADSELSISDTTGGGDTEIAFSDIISDSLFGDEFAGDPLGTFGALIDDAQVLEFDFSLAPGATVDLEGFWTLTGGAFTDNGNTATAGFDASLVISAVNDQTAPPTPLTAPSMAILFLGGVLIWRRFRGE